MEKEIFLLVFRMKKETIFKVKTEATLQPLCPSHVEQQKEPEKVQRSTERKIGARGERGSSRPLTPAHESSEYWASRTFAVHFRSHSLKLHSDTTFLALRHKA